MGKIPAQLPSSWSQKSRSQKPRQPGRPGSYKEVLRFNFFWNSLCIIAWGTLPACFAVVKVEYVFLLINVFTNLLMNSVLMFYVAVKDPRLRCVKELVYAEEIYNECLKSLFELYAEPLRYVFHACL